MLSRKGVLYCLVGPAGSGKTTVAERLLERNRGSLTRSISVTSRAPRQNEKEGIDYFFVSKDKFQEWEKAGKFFETESIHGNLYGTLKATVEEAIQGGRDLLLAIDIKGALTFHKAYPADTIIVFITPPSVEVLKQRLRARGSLSDEEFARRMQTAESEYAAVRTAIAKGGELDYFLLNVDLDETCRAAQAILDCERVRVGRLSAPELARICTSDDSSKRN